MTTDPQAPAAPAPAPRSSRSCPQRLGGSGRMHGDLAEVLALLPPSLTALVELEQREHGDSDRHAILAADRLLEGEVPAPEQLAQAIEALGDGDALNRDVAQVDRGRHAQQPPNRLTEHGRVL